jgi:hypothetical protein
MRIGITPSETSADPIRRKMEQAALLKIEIDDMRVLIALLESQIAMERSAFICPA